MSLHIVQAVHLIACALIFGGYGFAAFVLPGSAEHAAAPAAEALRGWFSALRCLAWLALLTAILWLWHDAAVIGGRPLLQTGSGHLSIWRLAAAVPLCGVVGFRSRMPGRVRGIAGLLLAAILLTCLAGAGHAATVPYARSVQVAIYTVHLLAAGAWIGGLPPLARVVMHLARGGDAGRALAAAIAERFSILGLTAVIGLFVTGMVNAGRWLGPLSMIAQSRYGQLLIAKLFLFAVLLGLAVYNRVWLTGALPDAERRAGALLARNAWIEFGIGLAILMIAATLAATPPGRAMG